jgi:hypothetical protein
LLLAACVFSLAGCAVPFGRSYSVERQRIEMSFSPAQPDRVKVHASYRLRNAGMPDIDDLELRLPDPANFTVENVHGEWSGHSTASKPVADFKDQLHFDFGGSLRTKARGEFNLAYDLRLPAAAQEANRTAIFLPSFGWYPLLLAAEGPLGSGGDWPGKWELGVTVPENFVVHASGRGAGKRRKGAETQWRFTQTAHDYLPFVVAGNYSAQQLHSADRTVIFWSKSPIASDRAAALSQRLAADDKYFSEEFSARSSGASVVWVIECPQHSSTLAERPWLAVNGCMTLPEAAVVPYRALSGTATPQEDAEMMHSIDMQLAASRFYFVARVDRNGPLYPLAATIDYAVFSLESSRDSAGRAVAVRALLEKLAAIAPGDTQKSLTAITRDDSVSMRDASHLRGELFYIALEDRCGAANVHQALARILRVMRGGAWSLSELRSAIEAECNSDLADFFHQWLDHPGIPDEFRQKYSQAAAAHP